MINKLTSSLNVYLDVFNGSTNRQTNKQKNDKDHQFGLLFFAIEKQILTAGLTHRVCLCSINKIKISYAHAWMNDRGEGVRVQATKIRVRLWDFKTKDLSKILKNIF